MNNKNRGANWKRSKHHVVRPNTLDTRNKEVSKKIKELIQYSLTEKGKMYLGEKDKEALWDAMNLTSKHGGYSTTLTRNINQIYSREKENIYGECSTKDQKAHSKINKNKADKEIAQHEHNKRKRKKKTKKELEATNKQHRKKMARRAALKVRALVAYFKSEQGQPCFTLKDQKRLMAAYRHVVCSNTCPLCYVAYINNFYRKERIGIERSKTRNACGLRNGL